MPDQPAVAEWIHRGCLVRLRADAPADERYAIRHGSGMPMGTAANLTEARILIDAAIPLLRQRLACPA
jgi:hypothetical protein